MPYQRIYAKIDLDALENNIVQVKKRLGSGTKLMAVIKADGYGHGAVPLAEFLEDKTEYFAVACIEEAIELRKNGIKHPILILGYTSPEDFNNIARHDITQTIYDFDSALKLSGAAADCGKTAKIHIAVDTGMTRIGFFDNEQSVDIIKKISQLPNINIEGIFSHYACADEADKTSAGLQTRRFIRFINMLENTGIKIEIKHLANSAAAIDLDEHFDMVRYGISLYGLYPSEQVKKRNVALIPVMELKAKIINIKTVEAGCGVSYGQLFVTKKPTRIATIAAGYADGYPRALSTKGRVLIKGEYAPILGRVCMDQMMVDVSHIDGLIVEDEATLIGCEGDKCITAEEIGSMSESFNYEVVCGIGRRVPRIYIKNGKIIRVMSYL
ncbi:MAG: alanine racemase [Clostridiales bacterium]|nr:alanine racemase [Clostridiales bacterium]